MNTKEALQQGNFDITNWLDEKKLGKTLDIIFPDEIFIHDKAVPHSGTRKRPDYRCENLKLIVEFDGSQHYNDVKWCYDDNEKDDTYIRMGYKIIRVPYFVQLSSDVIKQLFGIDIDYKQIFPHGFIVDKNEVLPADFCSLGYERFLCDLKRFSYIKHDILASLHHKYRKYKGDWNRVLPTYASENLKEEILQS